MIRRLFCALIALVLLIPSASAQPDMLRLHVIADDDSPSAQSLKLEVRDAVLLAARLLLHDCPNPQTAYAIIHENLSALESIAHARAHACGFDGPVHAEMGIFPFPDRIYGETLVPAGDYPALRVIIGDGDGQNWWCVLFPTLCVETDGHSFLVDWFKSRFGGESA